MWLSPVLGPMASFCVRSVLFCSFSVIVPVRFNYIFNTLFAWFPFVRSSFCIRSKVSSVYFEAKGGDYGVITG